MLIPDKTPQDPFALFFKAAALLKQVLPQILLASLSLAVLSVLTTNQFIQELDTSNPDAWQALLNSDFFPYLLVYGLISTYLGSVILFSFGQAYLPHVSGNAYTRAAQTLLPMLIANFLYYFLAFLGSFALVLPGIFLLISLAFASSSILFENKSVMQSLGFSAFLVKDNWWHTASTYALPLLIMLLLAGVLSSFFSPSADAALLPETTPEISPLQYILDIAIETVLTPLFYAVTVVIFYDLKLRRLPSSDNNDDDYLAA